MSKIAFMTLGCKVNQADTASMQMLFREAGYEVCDFNEIADVYLVNTCVVTNAGQQKSRQMIRRAIRRNPAALVVVAGCYPQTAAEEVKTIQGVDLLIGTQDRAKVVTLVEAAAARKRQREQEKGEDLFVGAGLSSCKDQVPPYKNKATKGQVYAKDGAPALVEANQKVALTINSAEGGYIETEIDDAVRPWAAHTRFEEMAGGNEEDKTRAYLKIQEGCNQYCSFCIIPYARGPLRSRSLSGIRSEVERLTAQGYEEVVLIGIHLGCYGKERTDGTTLYDAVEAALAVPELHRLRLGSLESVEVEERLLEMMAREPRLCPHLHLPLQSGCDKILRDMHRPYDTARFAALLSMIRSKVPDVAVTTDIIVGFPGETEEDFQATYEFARQCGFAKIHIFPYSMRKGTPAAARKDQIPESVKHQRAEKMAVLDAALQQAYFEQNVGRKVQVLVEQVVTNQADSTTAVANAQKRSVGSEFTAAGEASDRIAGGRKVLEPAQTAGNDAKERTADDKGQVQKKTVTRVEGLSENYIRV
ncbi:MAG: tRNA (N(6)-L-threonylcarbamoyladenosine(37)-C(2))-methylthiotransferase MtaB, partial [Succiniclasticum sp.]|nr:tRNA (N(6)-L-threonylcarbamoyladenosine(37)-C(2))-methylthiotransferase MtaB [Succiniclasticum sp.]